MNRFSSSAFLLLLFLSWFVAYPLQAQEDAKAKDPSTLSPSSEEDSGQTQSDDDLVLAQQVRAMVTNGETRDAWELIQAKMADDPDQYSVRDIERSFALVASGFSRIRNAREAYKTLDQLWDYQLEQLRAQNQDVRISRTVRAMLALAPKVKKQDEITALLDQSLQGVEAMAGDNPSVPVAIELADIRGAKASALIQDGELAAAVAILKSESLRLETLYETHPEDPVASAAFVRSLSNLLRFTDDVDERDAYYERHQSIVKKQMNAESENGRFAAQYLATLLFKANLELDARPALAIQLIDEGEKVLADLEITNPEATRSLQQAKAQFQAFRNRAASRQAISEMLGKPAPKLAAEFWVNGDPLTSEDLEGKVVLLDFWAMWSRPCVATFPKINEWNESFSSEGLQIIGVTGRYNLDWDEGTDRPKQSEGAVTAEQELETIEKFMEKAKLLFPTMVLEKGSKMPADFAVAGIPYLVLIDKKGNFRMAKIGGNAKNMQAIEAMIKELLAE